MTTDSTSDSHAFYDYLGSRLQDGRAEESPEALVQEWRMQQGEFEATEAGLREAIADMEAGDHGRPLNEVAEEIRRKHGFSATNDA